MQLKLLISVTVVLVAVGVGVLVLWTPSSAPEWAEERQVLKTLIRAKHVAMMLAHPVSWVTGRDYLQAFRSVISFLHVSIDFNSPSMKVSHTELDGVPAQVFHPQPSADPSPAIIYLHGGGWSFLDAEIYEETCHYMAVEFNVVVILIDYRQSPEFTYPTPFQDCLKAVLHILNNARDLGLDPDHIAIAGDSAGGNLAAAISLKLSQPDVPASLPPLKFQVLIYPALQMVDFNTQSYTNFSTHGLLTRSFITKLWLCYLGYPELRPQWADFEANLHSFQLLQDPQVASRVSPDLLPQELRLPGFEPVIPNTGNQTLAAKVRSRILDPYFNPLMAEDVSRVPQAYFIMANIDGLRDDGFMYAERLRRAGVETEVDFYPSMAHGFLIIPSVQSLMFQRATQALDNLGKFVKEHL